MDNMKKWRIICLQLLLFLDVIIINKASIIWINNYEVGSFLYCIGIIIQSMMNLSIAKEWFPDVMKSGKGLRL